MEGIEQKKLADLIVKCWMTHDGLWFYHCLAELGIEKTNKLNKAAIQSLAPIEVIRLKKMLGIKKDRMESYEEFRSFMQTAAEIFIPDFIYNHFLIPVLRF